MMDYGNVLKISQAREYRVVKANDLIQKTRYQLAASEQKILAYIISKIKPRDKKLKVYELKISDYCEIAGINERSGKNYKNVKESIKSLADKSFWLELEDGSLTIFRWLNKVWLDPSKGIINIRLDDDLSRFLLSMSEKFTQYELFNIIQMKSKYSIRIYELLKSYQFKKSHTFELDELKERLMATSTTYGRYTDFRRKILEPVINEINTYTDLKVSYTPIKNGRAVEKIRFDMKEKSNIEQNIDRIKFDKKSK